MPATRYDVFAMCNALYDIQAEVSDELLAQVGFVKGSMSLVSHEQQRAVVPQVYDHIVNTEAGGSGANTAIGVALLGGKSVYTSRIGRDEHGKMYRDGLMAKGVVPQLGVGDGDTGISLILISPDAERTMGTYLGMSQDLEAADVDAEAIKNSAYINVTGYLWDTENQKEAIRFAMKTAKENGVKVAFSLSDSFCVARHKTDFDALLATTVDLVFANKDEATAQTGIADVRAATLRLAEMTNGIAAVTVDASGSLLAQGEMVYEIPSYKVTPVDTTGAGDMYAAGLLYGLAQELPLPIAGRIASYTAAQVVAKLGPRLESVDGDAIAAIRRGEM